LLGVCEAGSACSAGTRRRAVLNSLVYADEL
jgi:hypothetical protein